MAKRSYVLLFALALVTCAAGVYKWVDQKGVTHYSDRPPIGHPSQAAKPVAEVVGATPDPIAPAAPQAGKPPDQLEREFRERQLKQEAREFEERRAERERARASLTASDPQSRLASSEYLVTTQKWINYEMHFERLAATLGLAIQARRENKQSVWLWVVFELPLTPSSPREVDNPDPPLMTVPLPKMIRALPNEEVKIEAPTVEHLRCRNYVVSIVVYADSAGRERLGEHAEFIYSRLNGSGIRSDTELAQALRTPGKCVPPVSSD